VSAAAPVIEGSRRRRSGGGIACLVLLGLTLAALAHVAVQARLMDVALELGTEQKRRAQLGEEHARLQSEIARLKDPAYIERLAREKLNMGPPPPPDIRRLPEGEAKLR
jgi:cell division protein FtsL